MSSGQHASGGRSPNGQPGLALGRGVLLLVVAIVVGVVLLRTVPTPKAPLATPATTTTTSAAPPADEGGTTRTTTPTPLAPSKVTVLVANGTSVPAGAGNLVTALKNVGYMVLVPYDTNSAATASAVYYEKGFAPEAAVLAKLLGQPASEVAAVPSPLPVTTTSTFDVMVVEGSTLATRFANPTSLGTTTTSTTSTSSTTSTTLTTS